MLILNPLKPFYENVKEKKIRMGNFKDSALEIEYEDDSLKYMIECLKKPIEKEKLISHIRTKYDISVDDIESAIDYLFEEGFIIKYEDYLEIINNDSLSRQSLFFSMINGNVKKWKLKKQPNILILGLGGIGSNCAVMLERAGFKKFTIVDYDKVEESNLIRQIPYKKDDIGKMKTDVLKQYIVSNDKNCEINSYNIKINTSEDIETLIEQTDFIICTLDKPLRIIRRLINNLCVKHNKPVIFSGFSENVGMIGPFVVPHKSACLKCIEKELDDVPLGNVKIAPSYGPLCILISSLVSNEVINYFYKFNNNSLVGKTLMFNIATYECKTIKWKRNKNCEVCNESK